MTEVVVNVLNDDKTPKTPEEVENERQQIIAEGNTPIVPGSKTDSALLLRSLQEERVKRQELENKLELLTKTPNPSGLESEEAKALKVRIEDSESKIRDLSSENTKKDLLIAHPILSDRWAEFETFRADPENKGMNLKTAAKAFLVENGLLDAKRPGLEKSAGGPRGTPVTKKMTVEEAKQLRETNFKKYTELLEKGLIDV